MKLLKVMTNEKENIKLSFKLKLIRSESLSPTK